MKTIPLCTADIRKTIKSAYNPNNYHYPRKMQFLVGLQVDDDLHKKIELDDKLANKIFAHVSKEYKGCIKNITALSKDIDQKMDRKGYRRRLAKEWQEQATFFLEEAEATMLGLAKSEINAWRKVRKDRKNYKIKTAAKLTVGSLALTTATVGSVVASAGGGPGLVVALYGNIKAFVNLVKEIRKLRLKMEQAEEKLKKHLKKLVDSYKDATKKKTAGKEIVAAAIQQITTYQKVSISACESEFATFHGKLAGIDVKASESGTKLHGVLDRQTQLEKKIIQKTQKQLNDLGYKSKKLPGLQRKLDEAIDLTKELIKDTKKLYKRVEEAQRREQNYEKTLKMLKAKKADWVKWAEASLKLTDLALGASFTDFSAAEQVLVLVDSIGVEVDDLLVEELEG